jgi:23S rRNA (cytidine1920-2'-O)/16S rRNA (cytidine1409-2'-O)-methyltransferase
MASKKERLDVAMTDRGLTRNRSEAKAAIMAGLVRVDEQKIDKAGFSVTDSNIIELVRPVREYVSRGGEKITGAYKDFNFQIEDRNVIDGGASTGGFTDFMLKHGASHVYAIDVGYGQLDWSLRKDDRVTVMERTNLREVLPEHLKNGTPDIAVMDLSFISLTKVIPALKDLLEENCEIITLVKPQFEAGPSRVGKGGIVREEKLHKDIFIEVVAKITETDFRPVNCTWSPIKGPKGNIEFFLHLVRGEKYRLMKTITNEDVEATVEKAHKKLNAIK